MPDEWESLYGLNPNVNDSTLDKDNDGLTNIQEYWLGLNPNNQDTDGDGLSDGAEINTYGTNPLLADTDADGMPDGWEVSYGLDPRRNDAKEDRDFDFLTNLQEYQNSPNPAAPAYNPSLADTDSNGTPDYEQLNAGKTTWRAYYDRDDRLRGMLYERGTSLAYRYDGNGNPTGQARFSRDGSGTFSPNGLPDAWEYAYGLNPQSNTGANGPNGDADGDGFSNLQEYLAGTNPTDSNDKPSSDGTVAATVQATFTPTNFVMIAGQLDGSGAEEIVVGADGNPGASNNTLTILTQNGATWVPESVNVGTVGVTSLAISKATTTTPAAIYFGTRAASGSFGQVRKLTKVAGVWQSTTLATSTDTTAFVSGVRDNGDLIAQLSQAATNAQALYTITSAGAITIFQNTTALAGVPMLNRNGSSELGITRRVAAGVEFTPLPTGSLTSIATPPATSGGQNLVWQGVTVIGSLMRGDLGTSPSIVQLQIDDKNSTSTVDGADDFVLTETLLSGTQTLTQSRLAVFSASNLPNCIASARPANAVSDLLFTGEPGGNVFLWKSPGASAALQRQIFNTQYTGKMWHQLRAWHGLTAGDSLAGLAVAPATPSTCQVVVWDARAIELTTATTLTQTAPTARVISTPASGAAFSRVNVKLWDSEGNPSRVSLQYQSPPNTGPWLDATLSLIDGASVGSAPALTAPIQGATHQIIWNAASNLVAAFQGSVLLRARAADFANTGAWSEPMIYTVDTTIGDADHDGLPDGWEIANGLDPATPNATADPDGDGIANLMEFALGLNPNLNTLIGLPVVSIEGGYLTLTVTRNAAATALQFNIQVTGNLSTWYSDAAYVTVLTNTSTLLKARDNTPFTPSAGRFIRLQVVAP